MPKSYRRDPVRSGLQHFLPALLQRSKSAVVIEPHGQKIPIV